MADPLSALRIGRLPAYVLSATAPRRSAVAANYLHAAGAPGSYRQALFAYNPSALYVDAVLRYARQIERDRRAYYDYYSRQVFVRTPAGIRRVTGPGLR